MVENNEIEILDDTETVTVIELDNTNREDVQMDHYITVDGLSDEPCDMNYPDGNIEAPRRGVINFFHFLQNKHNLSLGNTIPRPHQDDDQVPPTISTLAADTSLPVLSRI